MSFLNLDKGDFEKLLNKTDFSEEPVDLKTFCTDPYYLGFGELSDLQYEIIQNMTQIYTLATLQQLYGQVEGKEMWDKTVNEVVCEIGKGGGKDFSIRIAFCRIIYLLHCLRDPLGYYQKGKGEYIDLLNVAINADQAKNVFFDPMKNVLAQSPYFQEKGMEFRSKEIMFWERPIRCFSGHSGAEGWEGYNLMAVVLDEISAFKTDAELGGEKNRYAASTIYNMARNSVISRFPDVGKIALLSFPRYQGDFIEERYEAVVKTKKTNKRRELMGLDTDNNEVFVEWNEDIISQYYIPKVWALKCPSFYTNPERKVTDYLSSYLDNPVECLSRFFCMPPKAEQAYFRDPDRVRLCFSKDEPDIIPLNPDGTFKEWFKVDKELAPKRFIQIDLGLVRDRAAVCMVHCIGSKAVNYFDGTQNIGLRLPVIKMDIINYWEAQANAEIDFEDIRRFVFNLADRFPVEFIGMDRWNSQDTIKAFNTRGLHAEYYVVEKEAYDTLSSAIYDGRLSAYHQELLVEEELLKLQLLKGKKIDHPKTGFKDGADCLAGAVFHCTERTPIDEDIEIGVLGFDTREDLERTVVPRKESVPKNNIMPEDLEEFISRLQIF